MLKLAAVLFGCLFTLASGYALGSLCLRTLRVPRIITLAVGSSLLSLLVFLLFLLQGGHKAVFLLVGFALIIAACLRRVRAPRDQGHEFLDPLTKRLLAVILGAYGILYLVHALAPEIQADAFAYHLGLISQYLRIGRFSDEVSFYAVLPQGLEMLFAFGFAFGRHSAAKLIHFAFLITTLPLILAVARRLALSPATAAAAAVLYLCAPVVGISGTCAYNDAAVVFYSLATFYVLLLWNENNDNRYLLLAGILAGFCYAIKLPGLLIPAAVGLYLLARRRWWGAAIFSAGAVLMIGPWMIRAAVMTGNPLAPMLNQVFPNPYFHLSTQQNLSEFLQSYGGVTFLTAPLEIILRGERTHGMLGPLFLLAPLSLLALRKRAGRILLFVGTVLAIPWFLNIGTRFIMPSLPFLALAMAMVLPRPVALAAIVLHALSCWPGVTSLYEATGAWRLRGFPVKAALRIEPEEDYLQRTLWEYRVARMVEAHTKPDERILDLTGAARAYIRRDMVIFWQSAQGERLSVGLGMAAQSEQGYFLNLDANWPEQPLLALRFRQTTSRNEFWTIQEIRLKRGGQEVRRHPDWLLSAWPNVWEAPLAFDGNRISRWATWEPMRPGMHLDIEFDSPIRLNGASLLCFRREEMGEVELHGLGPDGVWRLLSRQPVTRPTPELNYRSTATRKIKQEGIHYILVAMGDRAYEEVGRSVLENASGWGLATVGREGNAILLRIL